jgi:hypothetical protein
MLGWEALGGAAVREDVPAVVGGAWAAGRQRIDGEAREVEDGLLVGSDWVGWRRRHAN